MFKNLTKKERAWVLYDVGNSAFTMLACSLIPIFFKALAIGEAPGQITGDQATAYYSIAISVVTIIVAVLGPERFRDELGPVHSSLCADQDLLLDLADFLRLHAQ